MEGNSSNTYIFDSESPTEMARLTNQDCMTTQAMGGPFAGLSETEIDGLSTVLDLGCGPGGWVLDAAFQHAGAEIAGVDSSCLMIDYANARARTQGRHNASFGVMDITKPLEFPDASFDLVNARFLFAVLLRDAWPPFLKECWRVLRPGGVLRLTEVVDLGQTNSPDLNGLLRLEIQALWHAGYGFSEDGGTLGLLPRLEQLLGEQGYQLRRVPHVLDFSASAEAWADHHKNIELIALQMESVLVKHQLISAEAFHDLLNRVMIALYQKDFQGSVQLLTLIGEKP